MQNMVEDHGGVCVDCGLRNWSFFNFLILPLFPTLNQAVFLPCLPEEIITAIRLFVQAGTYSHFSPLPEPSQGLG